MSAQGPSGEIREAMIARAFTFWTAHSGHKPAHDVLADFALSEAAELRAERERTRALLVRYRTVCNCNSARNVYFGQACKLCRDADEVLRRPVPIYVSRVDLARPGEKDATVRAVVCVACASMVPPGRPEQCGACRVTLKLIEEGQIVP